MLAHLHIFCVFYVEERAHNYNRFVDTNYNRLVDTNYNRFKIRIYSALRASYIRIYESVEFRYYSLTESAACTLPRLVNNLPPLTTPPPPRPPNRLNLFCKESAVRSLCLCLGNICQFSLVGPWPLMTDWEMCKKNQEQILYYRFSHSCCWLSLRDVWWDHPTSHSLLLPPLLRLISPFQIDIRTRKCLLHHWYGKMGSSQHKSKRLGLDVVTCAEMVPSRLTSDAVCIYYWT